MTELANIPASKPAKPISIHTRVYIPGIRAYGYIRKIRFDDAGVAILTVDIDQPTNVPDALYMARQFEVIDLS